MKIKKSDDRVNNFLKLNSSIDDKNKKLEELVNRSQTLQYVILDIETRIEFFTVKTKDFIDSSYKLNEVINCNNSKLIKKQKEIQSLISEREELIKKIKALEDEDINFNKTNQQKKEEKKNMIQELKTSEDINKEKDKDEQILNDLNKKENLIQKNISKNEKTIVGLNNDIKFSERKLERYINERQGLIEKSNIPKKGRDRLKNLENEIKNVKNEIEENKKILIENERINNELIKKINELSKELENKTEEHYIVGEELDRIRSEYEEKVPKEYRKKIEDQYNKQKNQKNEKENKNVKDEKEKKDCLIF
jgi:chromosome segregation ATPase